MKKISKRLGISKDACYKRVQRLREKVLAIVCGETPPADPESG